jgi:uncharacterized membrane protein YhaH (DUF805 family)
MDAQVQLVFFGEVLEGFHLDDVKRRLAQLLKLDEVRVAQMFSGARTVLKRAVAHDDAQRYASVLAKAGARIHIEPNGARPATPAPVAKPAGNASGMGFPEISAEPLPTFAPAPAPASHRPQPATSATPFSAPKPTALRTLELEPIAAPAPAASTEDEITCPTCGDRQSKRILCRKCATDMPMGIAAKVAAEQEARQAKNDEYLARRAAQAGRASSPRVSSPGTFGFSMTGRMARMKYAISHVWMLTVLYLLVVLVLARPDSIGRLLFSGLGMLVVTYMSARLSVLRCHDCDKTGWWAMLTFVPSVNAIFGLVLSFAPGTNGDNEYGEQPEPSSWRYMIVAGLCLILAFALTIKGTIRAAEHHKAVAEEDDTVHFDGSGSGQSVGRSTGGLNLPNQAARDAYEGAYAGAGSHKAFAMSSRGAWGMASNAASPREAMQAAISDCEVKRESYSPHCVAIDVDGQSMVQRGR